MTRNTLLRALLCTLIALGAAAAQAKTGWGGPRESLNFPRIVNLRSDPYETSIDSGLYSRFFADQLWLFVPTQQEVGKWLMTFREFPPRQATASFTIDTMMQQMQQMLQMGAMGAAPPAARPPGQ